MEEMKRAVWEQNYDFMEVRSANQPTQHNLKDTLLLLDIPHLQ